jgi:hypothetical protein
MTKYFIQTRGITMGAKMATNDADLVLAYREAVLYTKLR